MLALANQLCYACPVLLETQQMFEIASSALTNRLWIRKVGAYYWGCVLVDNALCVGAVQRWGAGVQSHRRLRCLDWHSRRSITWMGWLWIWQRHGNSSSCGWLRWRCTTQKRIRRRCAYRVGQRKRASIAGQTHLDLYLNRMLHAKNPVTIFFFCFVCF